VDNRKCASEPQYSAANKKLTRPIAEHSFLR
jgi:hypothetical protein